MKTVNSWSSSKMRSSVISTGMVIGCPRSRIPIVRGRGNLMTVVPRLKSLVEAFEPLGMRAAMVTWSVLFCCTVDSEIVSMTVSPSVGEVLSTDSDTVASAIIFNINF